MIANDGLPAADIQPGLLPKPTARTTSGPRLRDQESGPDDTSERSDWTT
jgi:hypothetical protein